jgi:hypothetical protein
MTTRKKMNHAVASWAEGEDREHRTKEGEQERGAGPSEPTERDFDEGGKRVTVRISTTT